MTTTIVEAVRRITGGVDTHRDLHVAAAFDPLDGLLRHRELLDRCHGYRARCSDHEGTDRLKGTPNRAETVECYHESIGWKVQHLRYNEVLAALLLAVPLLLLGTHLKLGEESNLADFCSTRSSNSSTETDPSRPK